MLRDYVRRLLRLAAGIAVSSLGIVLMLQANVGLEPWSVLQQGLTLVLPVSYGLATVIAGAAAIGLAVLFGESFGVGTIVNIIGCGVCIDAMLALDWVPQLHSLPGGIAMLLAGLELLALGTWMYMRSALGAGPRDALMVALARKTGHARAAAHALFRRPLRRCLPHLYGYSGHGLRLSARRPVRHWHGHLRARSRLAHQSEFQPAAFPPGEGASGKHCGNAPLSPLIISAPPADSSPAGGAFLAFFEFSLAQTAKKRDNRERKPVSQQRRNDYVSDTQTDRRYGGRT